MRFSSRASAAAVRCAKEYSSRHYYAEPKLRSRLRRVGMGDSKAYLGEFATSDKMVAKLRSAALRFSKKVRKSSERCGPDVSRKHCMTQKLLQLPQSHVVGLNEAHAST